MTSPDPYLGTTIEGGYELVECIDAGKVGRRYEAWHRATGKHVVIRLLEARHAIDELVVRRFAREARALQSLSNPCTQRVLGDGKLEDGSLFLVLEHLEGVTLHALVKRSGALDVRRAVSIVSGVAGALDEAHAQGIVHRNVKPENVFLIAPNTPEERPKLIDFVHAKLEKPMPNGSLNALPLTMDGATVGTPAFMSPEQIRALPVDGRSDIYALGLVLYEALTGKLPWDVTAPTDYIERHTKRAPMPIDGRAPERQFPPELWPVIERALAKEPDARWQTAGEFAAALCGAVSIASESDAPEARRPSLGPVVAVTLTALVLGGLAIAYVLARS